VACGAALAAAGMKTAWMNVIVNTSVLKDRPYAEARQSEGLALLTEYTRRADGVFDAVEKQLVE
jgi:formiminotetrahydrofolate cyclodeaminase